MLRRKADFPMATPSWGMNPDGSAVCMGWKSRFHLCAQTSCRLMHRPCTTLNYGSWCLIRLQAILSQFLGRIYMCDHFKAFCVECAPLKQDMTQSNSPQNCIYRVPEEPGIKLYMHVILYLLFIYTHLSRLIFIFTFSLQVNSGIDIEWKWNMNKPFNVFNKI